MVWKKVWIALMVLVLAASAIAFERKGTTALGVRAGVFMPLFNGDNFSLYKGSNQPFLAGWDFGIEARRGLSQQVAVGLTFNYLSTYDDTTTTDNAGDEFYSSENALAKLTGMAFGIDAQWYYAPEWRFQPYLLGGIGIDMWSVEDRASEDSYKSTDFNFKIGTGLFVPLSDKVGMDFQAKLTTDIANLSEDFPEGFYGPSTWEEYSDRPFKGYFEATVGLAYFFGGKVDTDRDGVEDALDECPDTPRGVKVDARGCPLDSDGDGVPDYLDRCPDTPTGAKVDAQGCPLDSDGDGVPDYLDKCPNTPSGVAVDPDGCPPDADGDGVGDYADQCPDTPAGVKVDAQGCPLDSDGDGVPDYLDKCPGTPRGIEIDSVGCPLVQRITEKITLNIQYATNSYEPDDVSKQKLDSIALRIFAYPDTKIEIRGYTDSQGPEAHNQTLSENRANGVKDYLISKGVPAEQLTAKGFGEDPNHFVANNATAEGRAKNRRVEIEQAKE
jgi:outer membrane protein OmpA-like peptidoglycan-associated protein/opacity protein-like surface antigen